MKPLKVKDVFPEMFRAFVDGELSLCMERFGGINEIGLIDVLEHEGKPFPDRSWTPIFSRRKKKSMGRPLYGSAIRFLSEDRDGRAFYHYPNDPELYPWGVRGEAENHSMEMILDRKRVIFRCAYNECSREKFLLTISKAHLFDGCFSSIKNQRVMDHCDLHYQHAGIPFDAGKPFPNGPAEVKWDAPRLDAGENAFIFRADIQFPYAQKELFLVVASDIALGFSEDSLQWVLSAKWDEREKIYIAFAFGDTLEQALAQAKDGCARYSNIWTEKLEYYGTLENEAPVVDIKGLPSAGRFMQASVGYQNSMLVANGIGVRAAAFKFGYFAMWDTISPLHSFLWNGQCDAAKKIIEYISDYPCIDNSAFITPHIILMLNEILAYDDDPKLMETCWPRLKAFFEVALKLTSQETGLILCYMNAGVDYPEELGLSGLYHSACINGWWYGACRVLENLALSRGEEMAAKKARHVIDLLEKNYLKAFYVEDVGYLRTGVNMTGEPAKIDIFQNTSTLGLEYGFGQYLMRSVINKLAAYQATKLYHPMGHSAVAWDSKVCCEMWKSVHMNQHLGHECKLARYAGDTAEAYRVMRPYLDAFEQYKVAVETFNLAGDDGNATQTANWQTFSATAAEQAIITGLAGIGIHRGGVRYIPASDDHEVKIERLKVKSCTLNIHIKGNGCYVTKTTLNGVALEGSVQIPADRMTSGVIEWVIERGVHPSDRPVLLNALDMPVSELISDAASLEFTLARTCHVPIFLQCPCAPRLEVNGEPLSGEWNSEALTLWIDRKWHEGDRLKVRC